MAGLPADIVAIDNGPKSLLFYVRPAPKAADPQATPAQPVGPKVVVPPAAGSQTAVPQATTTPAPPTQPAGPKVVVPPAAGSQTSTPQAATTQAPPTQPAGVPSTTPKPPTTTQPPPATTPQTAETKAAAPPGFVIAYYESPTDTMTSWMYTTNIIQVDGKPVQVHPKSQQIAAIAWDSTGGREIRVYYVATDGKLREVSKSGNQNWVAGSVSARMKSQFPIAEGSPISASSHYDTKTGLTIRVFACIATNVDGNIKPMSVVQGTFAAGVTFNDWVTHIVADGT